MFDSETARLLRSAPSVPGLNPNRIPALLTGHYARLVSARLRGDVEQREDADEERWPLERIADTYEMIAAIHDDQELRRSAAFVAGTAQQILARRDQELASETRANVERERLNPVLAAPLLFLIAEQYADASEAASLISTGSEQTLEAQILSEHIADLARGRLLSISERAGIWRTSESPGGLEEGALAALLESLIAGIELLASQFLATDLASASADRYDSPDQAFDRVLDLSARMDDNASSRFGALSVSGYAGPHHLAALLLAAYGGLKDAALTQIPPPEDTDGGFWSQWLAHRAQVLPYVWPNHREAINEGFHHPGKSSVVVLPTGAGKTTVSSLKVAATLARNKKVVFLVPTHALVDQLTEELREIFPSQLLGSVVSNDFDLLLQAEVQLSEIEVMTPERCLAMLSFAPEAFEEVGLMVFDECHLLSPQSGKVRRAIDGMLCVLGFNYVVPQADMLFLSAMIRNGEEFANWLGELTSRECVAVDLLWKPSRQARGVVIYKEEDLEAAKRSALKSQRNGNKTAGKTAKSLRVSANEKLRVEPWAIWGLEHNWLNLSKQQANVITSRLQDGPVQLSGTLGSGDIRLKPNVNQVAASLAATAARNGLKTIVFVNTKADAVSTAKRIAEQLEEVTEAAEFEAARWDALQIELGDLRHSVLDGPAAAVPHNAAMLRLERDLAERMFRRSDGASVIVATPTLAQGLNLPAHIAILAGDKRADPDNKGRASLEAHEILNAAARAGRAGHLANGVVLLIPEPIMSFSEESPLSGHVVRKLQSVLPEDDRCVSISDPLEAVLDRLMQGHDTDPDVQYVVNRMRALNEMDGGEEAGLVFDVRKSLGAFLAKKKGAQEEYDQKVSELMQFLESSDEDSFDQAMTLLAARSGLSLELLERLRERISDQIGELPLSVEDWLSWTLRWLNEDDEALESLLRDIQSGVLGACGRKKSSELKPDVLDELEPGLMAWLRGRPLCDIEAALGGDPGSTTLTKRLCPRARDLVGSVVPRGLSFVMSLVSHVVVNLDPFEQQPDLDKQLVELLSTAVRRGFDSIEKLQFANENPRLLSRVQAHESWAEQASGQPA